MTLTRHSRIVHVVLSLIVCAGVIGAPSLNAQEAPYRLESLPSMDAFGDFVVGPGKIELSLSPGESKTVDITLSNRMGLDKTFNISVEDMKGSDNPEQTVVLLGDDRGPYSLRDYFTIPDTAFDLPHGKKAVIPVTVSIPADAEPGGYYGSVLFSTASSKDEAAMQAVRGATAIVSRIGVLFFVTVPGAQEYAGELESFSSNKTFYTEGPVSFQMLFRNTGNIHLNPSGKIIIKNMIGTEVDAVDVEPWFALPQSLRLRETSWNRTALAGRYTATAEISPGFGDEKNIASVTFWVLPWKPIAIGVLVVFMLLFVVRYIATHFEFKRKG